MHLARTGVHLVAGALRGGLDEHSSFREHGEAHDLLLSLARADQEISSGVGHSLSSVLVEADLLLSKDRMGSGLTRRCGRPRKPARFAYPEVINVAYEDFSLEAVESAFGLLSRPGDLFSALEPLRVAAWLRDYPSRGHDAAALVSEKARSEFLVAPILLAARDLTTSELSIYSGQRLDVDPGRGLLGECDYIVAMTPPVPRLRAPLITVLEAKKGDLESSLGQCAAQMVGARLFNERAGQGHFHVYGCVTSGEVWQFLRLEATELIIDRTRFFLDNVGGILAALQHILLQNRPENCPDAPLAMG